MACTSAYPPGMGQMSSLVGCSQWECSSLLVLMGEVQRRGLLWPALVQAISAYFMSGQRVQELLNPSQADNLSPK